MKNKITCLKCNGTDFEVKEVVFPVELKNGYDEEYTVDIKSPAYVCSNCEESIMDTKQMNIFRKKVRDSE